MGREGGSIWKSLWSSFRGEKPKPERRRSGCFRVNDLLYSRDMIRATELVLDEVHGAIHRLATKRALAEGRGLVTGEDAIQSIPDALREVLALCEVGAEFGTADG
jgi:hypothetical protein